MGSPQLEDVNVVRIYGEGAKTADDATKRRAWREHCYFDKAQGLWVLVRSLVRPSISGSSIGVVVSAVPLCKEKVAPTQSFSQLSLSNGIAIGDTEAKVIEMCGMPDHTFDTAALENKDPSLRDRPGVGSKFGKRTLMFLPEGEHLHSVLTLFVQVTDDKIVSLGLID